MIINPPKEVFAIGKRLIFNSLTPQTVPNAKNSLTAPVIIHAKIKPKVFLKPFMIE